MLGSVVSHCLFVSLFVGEKPGMHWLFGWRLVSVLLNGLFPNSFIRCSVILCVRQLVSRMVGWLVGWLDFLGCLVGWLFSWLFGWLVV